MYSELSRRRSVPCEILLTPLYWLLHHLRSSNFVDVLDEKLIALLKCFCKLPDLTTEVLLSRVADSPFPV
ncbi:hypothetical protein RvY_17218 [Ramazzottius varieornatus]|uniref:Uncharacterized protein n=1 Tax=Ramazzottius varieornatus TaxID=947166 RepID=A0A1D1W8I5_RAMVA|nr:hypothetical protein RvY_17218 [Ramazzottius varieornatus]